MGKRSNLNSAIFLSTKFTAGALYTQLKLYNSTVVAFYQVHILILG